jgi:hypothetical protein
MNSPYFAKCNILSLEFRIQIQTFFKDPDPDKVYRRSTYQ